MDYDLPNTCVPRHTQTFSYWQHACATQHAARLAKADLATATVMEMTDLAGTMGRHYAQKQVRSVCVCVRA